MGRFTAEFAEDAENFNQHEVVMYRLLLTPIVALTASSGFAHDQQCKCSAEDSTLSFRDQTLNGFFPLTRHVLEELLLADEGWTNGADSYRVIPGKGLRVLVPPMNQLPIKLDIPLKSNQPNRLEGQLLPIHLASS